MEAVRRERIIKQLQDVVKALIEDRPNAYTKCVDVTEKLFYTNDKVVLVMNGLDFLELSRIWHQHYDYNPRIINVFTNFQTPHGEVSYLIVDDSVKEMYGYITVK